MLWFTFSDTYKVDVLLLFLSPSEMENISPLFLNATWQTTSSNGLTVCIPDCQLKKKKKDDLFQFPVYIIYGSFSWKLVKTVT